MLFSIYSWMQFFFAPVLGRLSDRYGRRPILFLVLGSAVGYYVIGIAGTLRSSLSAASSAASPAATSRPHRHTSPTLRQRKTVQKAWASLVPRSASGSFSGPRSPAYSANTASRVPFYFAAGLSLANAIALYFLLPESIKEALVRLCGNAKTDSRLFESFKDLKFRELINLTTFCWSRRSRS